jgi:hypothetical protein
MTDNNLFTPDTCFPFSMTVSETSLTRPTTSSVFQLRATLARPYIYELEYGIMAPAHSSR